MKKKFSSVKSRQDLRQFKWSMKFVWEAENRFSVKQVFIWKRKMKFIRAENFLLLICSPLSFFRRPDLRTDENRRSKQKESFLFETKRTQIVARNKTRNHRIKIHFLVRWILCLANQCRKGSMNSMFFLCLTKKIFDHRRENWSEYFHSQREKETNSTERRSEFFRFEIVTGEFHLFYKFFMSSWV